MKTKILIAGNQDSVVDDFFVHTEDTFLCMTTSLRLEDIVIHLQYFEPDVFCYCVGKDLSKEAENIRKIKEPLRGADTLLALIGDKSDVDELGPSAIAASDILLYKPLNIKRIQDAIVKKMEDIRIEKEIEEKKRKDELERLASLARKHILIVDDDPVMLRTIKRYLEDDYNVATAPSGKFALKFLEQKQTDLVLLDYEMPEMSGHEIFKRIREVEKLKKLPVVFLTGVSDTSKIKAVLSLQPNGYLLKPVEYDMLRKTVSDILDK